MSSAIRSNWIANGAPERVDRTSAALMGRRLGSFDSTCHACAGSAPSSNAASTGRITAVVGGLNAVGAIVSGSLLHKGANGNTMLLLGFVLMAVTSTMTFVFTYQPHLLWIQMIAVGLFSISGATIPTTMTRVAVDLAPAGGSAPASMGLIQQIFNIGNFTGPMLLAGVATLTCGWNSTWWITCGFALVGILLTIGLSRRNSPFEAMKSHQG